MIAKVFILVICLWFSLTKPLPDVIDPNQPDVPPQVTPPVIVVNSNQFYRQLPLACDYTCLKCLNGVCLEQRRWVWSCIPFIIDDGINHHSRQNCSYKQLSLRHLKRLRMTELIKDRWKMDPNRHDSLVYYFTFSSLHGIKYSSSTTGNYSGDPYLCPTIHCCFAGDLCIALNGYFQC